MSVGMGKRLGDRVLAAFFDVVFAFPILKIALAAVALGRGELLSFGTFAFAVNCLLLVTGSYHALLASHVHVRSPGELIVGYARDKSEQRSPSPRPRWLLYVCVFSVLMVGWNESFNLRELLSNPPASPQVSSPEDLQLPLPENGRIFSAALATVLVLAAAMRVSAGGRGWLIGGAIFFSIKFAFNIAPGQVVPAGASAVQAALFALAVRLYRRKPAPVESNADEPQQVQSG